MAKLYSDNRGRFKANVRTVTYLEIHISKGDNDPRPITLLKTDGVARIGHIRAEMNGGENLEQNWGETEFPGTSAILQKIESLRF